jgi:hypothetical protein
MEYRWMSNGPEGPLAAERLRFADVPPPLVISRNLEAVQLASSLTPSTATTMRRLLPSGDRP